MDQYAIYPKQFNKEIIPVDKNRCFVLMPFNENYDALYGSIKKTVTQMGIICNRDDEISGSAPFMNKVITEIIRSRYIIVVLTDYRPNVLYELGIVHTLKDLQNVLIIIESDSSIAGNIHKNASDLSHLTYIEYSKDNKFDLLPKIREFIESNRYVSDFYEILNIKGLTKLITETDNFAQYVQASLCSKTSIITNILSRQNFKFEDCENICYSIERLIEQSIQNNKISWIDGLVLLYSEILIAGENYGQMEVFCNNFMYSFFSRFPNLSDDKIEGFRINFAIYMAENKAYTNIVMPYIIDYFQRSKSTKVDLNRYKLESFLMSCNYKEIDDAIIAAIRHEDRHVREHMADIIGEKRLVSAEKLLIIRLKEEENYYTAVSIMEALGKISAIESKTTILQWCNDHEKGIILSQNLFVLKHAKNALSKLVTTISDPVIKQFDELFGKALDEI